MGKNNVSILNDLIEYCRINALWFSINYSETEDSWNIWLCGAGKGEDFFSGKQCPTIDYAVTRVLEKARSFYLSLSVYEKK